MEELSEYIYGLLDVDSVKAVATGGVWPLLADQETTKFVTYSFSFNSSESKDNYNRFQLNISCYGDSYKEALQIHDLVNAVLKPVSVYLDALESEYLEENKEAVVSSRYTLKRIVNT